MFTVVLTCAGACTILLLVWIGLEASPLARTRTTDRACAACYLALAVTSVVLFRHLVVEPVAGRGPLPMFVFLGAPIGVGLAWLAWRLARERQAG